MASNFGNWQCAIDNLTTTAKSNGCLKSFFTLDNNYKRIEFIHKKNFINDVAWLPLYWDNCHSMQRKSTEKAVHYRDDGNKYFKRKQYKSAVHCYTKSIQHASMAEVQQSPAFALGLGNRSAALFHLKQYQACIEDITMALASGCPPPTADKLKIRKIHCLVNLGRGQEAQQAIRDFRKHLSCFTDPEKKVKEKLEDDIANLELKLSQNWLGETDGQSERQLPELFLGPSEVITQASSAVEMKHTCSKGRHLVFEVSTAGQASHPCRCHPDRGTSICSSSPPRPPSLSLPQLLPDPLSGTNTVYGVLCSVVLQYKVSYHCLDDVPQH